MEEFYYPFVILPLFRINEIELLEIGVSVFTNLTQGLNIKKNFDSKKKINRESSSYRRINIIFRFFLFFPILPCRSGRNTLLVLRSSLISLKF